jgi:molybdopterin-containing oxidoreductase family iron-sulfur binding subunit
MEQKKIWQSFGELNQSEAFNKDVKDEFKEELPFVAEDDKSFLEAKAPRRDFLKYLGFSTAAAAAAASCEMPVRKSIPFANRPEEIVPGVSKYYATTYVQDGDVVSVLAKIRDGRPIKLEGNDFSPVTGGGTSARVQASVLDLYDTARLRFPTIDGKEVTFEAADNSIAESIKGATGAVILTSTITSPTTKEVIAQFLAKFPGSRHVTYDAVSYSGLLLANELTFGKKAIPSYMFQNAKAIVSLGADFLGTWLSPVEFAKQYAAGKKINEKSPEMSKHIHFESVASLTGSNADEKFLHRPSETAAIAAALLSAVKGSEVSITDKKLKEGIEKAAKALNANKGAALVVSGSNDVNVQVIVNAINDAIGAYGVTIDWASTLNYRAGIDADFVKLVEDMNAGSVGALLIQGANPSYSWFASDKFNAGLKKVKTSISFNAKLDETSVLCKYVLPDHHFLESWGDAEGKSGYISLIQPTINPLFKTRQWQDSLLKWSGATGDYSAYVKNYWSAKVGGETAWDKALQAGVINPSLSLEAVKGSFNISAVAAAVTAATSGKKGGAVELVLYEKVGIGAGQGASNPWLQELPDPVTRATWDNYVVVSPKMAKDLVKIDLNNNGQADAYEVNPPKPVVKVTVNGKSIELPVLIIPGTQENTIGIAVGYGRSENIGKAAAGVGKNAFIFAGLSGATVSFSAEAIVTATTEKYPVALTQTHSRYDTAQGNRTEVMKELTLAEYMANPKEILNDREEELKPYGGIENYEGQGTIYPVYNRPGIKWGMSVDLNSCNGCGACVVACSAENNVSVVGKPEVLRGHEMHWLRIDRYFSGDMENPNVVFQPMMCQHCDNAPCENVCPVAATNHSSEGLNQMTYNRCIGTRYCANNCPYKVRRFNWADYTGADSFPDNQEGIVNDVVLNMNDDLTRMVLNPDVTVRSRGVIEKCSFCVQRLQEAKLTAKKDSRPLEDGDLKVACQQACPTHAITFGNANNKESAISKVRVDNPNRSFYVLEQLHVLPGVTYLAKVRNAEEEKEAKAEKKEEKKAEKAETK